ncbi:uncharacterized protein LOC113204939 [Frankliniella occidentalis]|uniref:Uncharacterized protein LOC113204939 n=1 Tax=Frankliniella occidentalis TaxID=133901 RepID=A0A9C6U175_FRAOC|nr:uncharacterized protein LOC113204939 [Frankliniella occidentalis]
MPCPGRRSISSAVRTMTTTDDWLNNKSASHSPPTPTGPQPNNHLSQSRDSSPEGGVPMTSMSMTGMGPRRNRKADSVEVESVVMETNVNCRSEPEADPGSPTSAAQEQNARGAAQGAAQGAVPGAGRGGKHRDRGNKSRLFGSARSAGLAHPAPHRNNKPGAGLLLPNEAVS